MEKPNKMIFRTLKVVKFVIR